MRWFWTLWKEETANSLKIGFPSWQRLSMQAIVNGKHLAQLRKTWHVSCSSWHCFLTSSSCFHFFNAIYNYNERRSEPAILNPLCICSWKIEIRELSCYLSATVRCEALAINKELCGWTCVVGTRLPALLNIYQERCLQTSNTTGLRKFVLSTP